MPSHWESVSEESSSWDYLTTPEHDGVQVDQIRTGTSWSQPDKYDRPSRLVSDQHEDVYVSIEDGDDANGGRSKDDAYKTINRAIAEVPKFVYHRFHIHIDYGDYRGRPGPQICHINQSAAGNNGLKLYGHTENNEYYDESKSNEDIISAGGFDCGCVGSEELTVWGITVDGVWQSYDSSIRFRDCIFQNGSLSGPTRLIGGHRNRAQYIYCTFRDCEIVGMVSPLSFTCFERCEAENITNYGLRLYSTSIAFLDEADDIVEVPPNPSKKADSSIIVNHPNGLVQKQGGEPKSRGAHTFEDDVVLGDSQGDQSVSLRNESGDLVVYDADGNRVGQVQVDG
jgi:hypothetical protein